MLNGNEPPKAAATMVIELFPDQSIRVNGPIHDKLLCYGLLEMARDAVQKHHAEQQQRLVHPVRLIPGGS